MFPKEENYGLFLSIISSDKCYEELMLNLTLQPQDSRPPANATLQVTGAVGWRREGLVYKKNEVCFTFSGGENMYTNILYLACILTVENNYSAYINILQSRST